MLLVSTDPLISLQGLNNSFLHEFCILYQCVEEIVTPCEGLLITFQVIFLKLEFVLAQEFQFLFGE